VESVRSSVGPLPQAASRRERALVSGALSRIKAVESRIAAMEERLGTGPDDADLDEQIARARSERQSAADGQDYETAATLRDSERELLARQAARRQEWASANPSLPALAEMVRELRAEVSALAALVGGMGAEAGAGTAAEAAEGTGAAEGAGAAEGTGAAEGAGAGEGAA